MAWRRYQSNRYLLENTINHWSPNYIANKQHIPRFSSRQSLGAGLHISNKERPHVRLIPNYRIFSSKLMRTLPGIGDHDIVYIDSDITANINKPVKEKYLFGKRQTSQNKQKKLGN